MTNQAINAIKAAQNRHIWGSEATRRFCANHGVPPGTYRAARQCEAMPHRRISDRYV
jgi:hypothetical protein